MWQQARLSIVLPAFNEEAHIGRAVQAFQDLGLVDEIVVVDNNSTDQTAHRARQAGATVITELRQGYGFACRRGLQEATGDLIILSEPDGTFLARDILKLLAYADDFDVVFGTRTTASLIHQGANMGFCLKWGNWVVAKFLELLFGGPSLTDVGCTTRLIHRQALARLQPHFTVGGSHFSPEMMVLSCVFRLRMVEVPLNYCERRGVSKITGDMGRAVRVGLAMIGLILRYRVRYLVRLR